VRERIWERITPGACFAIGVAVGIIFMNIQKSILLTGGDLLSAESLKRITGIGAGGSALFAYVLRKRGAQFLLLTVFATTYLGFAACAVTAGWYGFSCGVFLAAGVLRYGMKGVLLVLAGIFPQYLFYVPVLCALIKWCDRTCRMIYGRGSLPVQNKTAPVLMERVLSLFVLGILLLVGCFLESYVNPVFLKAFVKIL